MHTLRDDDEAVSPVIGAILMVAITVLLTATAAAFVFNLGEDQNSQVVPSVAIDADYEFGSSDEFSFTHNSGDDLRVGDLTPDYHHQHESNSRQRAT